MHLKNILVLGLAALVCCAARVDCSSCNCGPAPPKPEGPCGACSAPAEKSGHDSCYPVVVRPHSLPTVDLASLSQPKIVCTQVGSDVKPLKPIGDLCSCKQTIVKPAVNPPSPNLGYYGAAAAAAAAAVSAANLQIPHAFANHYSSLPALPPGPLVPSAPADAVSQGIAYKQLLQQRIDKEEMLLSCGFQQLPKDVPCAPPKPAFPEEHMHAIRGEVLEYKVPKKTDDDEIDILLPLPEEEPYVPPLKVPSLGEIGYRVAKYKPGQFVDVAAQLAPCRDVAAVVECNDGFKPGEVVIKDTHVSSGVPPPPPPPGTLCLDEPEPPKSHGPPLVPYYSMPAYAAYSTSASSNSRHSSVLLRKLSTCS